MREIKRTAFEFVLLILMLIALAYAPVERYGWQQLLYKVILANAGFLNGHIVRKFVFPSVDWEDEGPALLKVLAVALYVMFIYAYTQGG